MPNLFKIFLQGLGALLPISLTIYVCYWLISSAETFFGRIFRYFLPPEYYWQGLGIVVSIGVVFIMGLLMNAWIVRKIFKWIENKIEQLPLVKTIFRGFRDVMNLISGSNNKKKNQRVVVVKINENMRVMGFATREDLSDLPKPLAGKKGDIAVYLPMAYMIGGYTLYLPRSQVEPIDWPVQDAMRFAITGGVSGTMSSSDK